MSDYFMIRSVERSAMVLKEFAKEQGGLTASQIAKNIGVHRSTVYRILLTLNQQGLIEQDTDTGKFYLSLTMYQLGNSVAHIKLIKELSMSHLLHLRDELNEVVHLAVLEQMEVLFIEKYMVEKTLRLYSSVGKKAPPHCTALGKVLLCEYPLPKLEKLFQSYTFTKYTSRTIGDWRDFKNELAIVKQRGYAVDNGEHQELVVCVAAPIRNESGRIIAAISSSVITIDFPPEKLVSFSKTIKQTAANISNDLGWNVGAEQKSIL